MRIIIVGQGGREHALAWRLSREGHTIIGMPGNPGIAAFARCVPASLADVDGMVALCVAEKPELVVIGPEAPLAIGLADALKQSGVTVFGPSQRATRIESSKAFAKDLMVRRGIPTARFVAAGSLQELDAALAELGGAVAVKADGLAAGKGVVVCSTVEEARAAGRDLLTRGPLILEERLSGPELSVIAICHEEAAVLLPTARDHKRLLDGDCGPNTGGMGTVAPIHVTESAFAEIRETVFAPTLKALAEEGAPFTGALFAGLMLTRGGPRVLEFNARFGDPETQSIVGTLGPDVRLAELLHDAAIGRLRDGVVRATSAACTVVVAAKGYPDTPQSGAPIEGIQAAQATGAEIFHAGTRVVDGRLVTAGGRVLGVMAQGAELGEARRKALDAARLIRFPGAQLRSDIGATSV